MTVETTRIGTADLAERLEENPIDLYQDAAERMEAQGIEEAPTFSRALEYLSPSEDGDELDAFGRLMRHAGIITRSNPEMGLWASNAGIFQRKGNLGRALLQEFFARQWRKVVYSSHNQDRAIFLSTDGIAGSWQRPYAEAASARWDQQIAPAIPLSEIIAMTTPVSAGDYRSFYLTYSAADLRQFRIGESADIPIAEVADSQRTIRLKKYGRGLQASYEQLRRMRVDKLAFYIRLMAVQSEVDKVAAGITILINGDGNSGTTPTTWDLNGDFSGTLQTLDSNSWLWFKKKFVEPYVLTTVLMTEAVSLQLEQLNIGSGNLLLNVNTQVPGAGSLVPINATATGVRYGWTSEVGTWQMLGLDRRMAMEYLTEVGGMINEMERFITNQTQVMTMTEVSGFAIMDSNAVKILDLND